MVHWKVKNKAAFVSGGADFASLTKKEPANLYYGFTMDGDKAVCKEGYSSAQGFLDHLGNVDGPLKAALKIADITSIEVHGPQGEVDKLRTPLKDFPVTYWNATAGAFYVPVEYGPARASMLDDTVSVMVYWKVKNDAAFLKGCDEFVALTKKEAANRYYGFTLEKGRAVCKEGYSSAQGFLDHLANVDAPLKAALKVADITSIEVHGPQAEVDKLREPLKAFPVTYWNYTDGAYRFKREGAGAGAADESVNVMVHWQVKNKAAFVAGGADFVALTKKETGSLYYGFTMSGEKAVCKEGYSSAQ